MHTGGLLDRGEVWRRATENERARVFERQSRTHRKIGDAVVLLLATGRLCARGITRS